MSEKCPKCGSESRSDSPFVTDNYTAYYWKCGSKEINGRLLRCGDCREGELSNQLAAANAEIERLRAREEPGRWFVTNRDQNDICIRGPYKYAETAGRVREEMELYGRYAKRNTNLGVFNMPEEDHPHA